MKEVADEVFEGKPYEIVRFGGDEIVFLTKPADQALMAKFFDRFNQKKKDFLIDRIGEDAYRKAKYETNVKAQYKLITQDKGYIAARDQGAEAVQKWIEQELGPEEAVRITDPQERFRRLAERRLPPESEWLEPLDFYRGNARTVKLESKNPEEIRRGLMNDIAKADNDIAWQKAHPGQKLPENRQYGEKVSETGGKYLEQAEEVSEFAERLGKLQEELAVARKAGDKVKIASLETQITRIRTRDTGTGAVRLDKARDYELDDIMPLSGDTEAVYVTQMDVPYFGVYNNHYDYATADKLMRELHDTLVEAYGETATVIRDGGNLIVLTPKSPKTINRADLKQRLDSIVNRYTNPSGKGSIDRRNGMRSEVSVKKMTTGGEDNFGHVELYDSHSIRIGEGTTVWNTVNEYERTVERVNHESQILTEAERSV